jgi:hypothetical protein
MKELLILIFLSVQAGDCAPVSFYLSPPPVIVPLSHSIYLHLPSCLHIPWNLIIMDHYSSALNLELNLIVQGLKAHGHFQTLNMKFLFPLLFTTV